MTHDNDERSHRPHGDSDDVDRALDRLTKAMEGTLQRLLREIQDLKAHQPTGFATERTQTGMLNTVSSLGNVVGALSAQAAENAKTLARIEEQLAQLQPETLNTGPLEAATKAAAAKRAALAKVIAENTQ